MSSQILTAQTEAGRAAIAQVMARSYSAEIDSVPPSWARALVVDGEPVSFILVDPERRMEYPGGDLPYAFINDVATRADRRREGHFRTTMAHTFDALRAAGLPLVLTHGRYPLYRRFGFDVFTHHCGIFVAPGQIETAAPGTIAPAAAVQLLVTEENSAIHDDLLLVVEARATSLAASKAVLQAAAALARQKGKARILFEHPPAPSYGSRYPLHATLETPLTALARTYGAQVCVQGADPEGSPIPDADWIKVLNAAALLEATARPPAQPLPTAAVSFDTDAGQTTIASQDGAVSVSAGIAPGAVPLAWPASALAQLVTGYRSCTMLSTLYDTPLPAEAVALLEGLYPARWRLSRNESWTFKS
ncbi:MAG: GNAT family N-acetyltransferase [Anaerolineae bacterium]|nr:GNAT family N-acetyltransferase [Anaerolineae bacterium]